MVIIINQFINLIFLGTPQGRNASTQSPLHIIAVQWALWWFANRFTLNNKLILILGLRYNKCKKFRQHCQMASTHWWGFEYKLIPVLINILSMLRRMLWKCCLAINVTCPIVGLCRRSGVRRLPATTAFDSWRHRPKPILILRRHSLNWPKQFLTRFLLYFIRPRKMVLMVSYSHVICNLGQFFEKIV